MDTVIDFIANAALYIAAFFGALALILEGLVQIAKLTPTSKDDVFLAKVQVKLKSLIAILNKVQLPSSKVK